MEEFEVEVIDKEPRFLEGQTGRSGVQMEPIRVLREEDGTLNRNHEIYIYIYIIAGWWFQPLWKI